LADRTWLSFDYRGATAIYPEAENWSLVMEFQDPGLARLWDQAHG
jgi:hypothetical protein